MFQLSPWTKVSLDKSLLGQKSPWTKSPWTKVSLDKSLLGKLSLRHLSPWAKVSLETVPWTNISIPVNISQNTIFLDLFGPKISQTIIFLDPKVFNQNIFCSQKSFGTKIVFFKFFWSHIFWTKFFFQYKFFEAKIFKQKKLRTKI